LSNQIGTKLTTLRKVAANFSVRQGREIKIAAADRTFFVARNLVAVLYQVRAEFLAVVDRKIAQQTNHGQCGIVGLFVAVGVHPTNVLAQNNFLIEIFVAQWTLVWSFAGMDSLMLT
jgi:hypothetical protein